MTKPDRETESNELTDQSAATERSESSPTSPASRSGTDPMEKTSAFEGLPESGGVNALPPAPAAKTNDIPTTLGRFKINGVLGQGGFGTVYLGFDDRLKRNVAIKVPTQVLSGVELDKFLEEAQRLAQLRHPGIVTVFDVGEFEGRCYIVSDYLEGLSLSDWMKANPSTWRESALITAQLADALAHAHVNGTVHRDIKPSNVMMLSNDQPVLIDFGLAISDSDGARESPGMMTGTVSYMSPEQTWGKAHRIDGRTDIYALGVVLYGLLCRKRPFSAKHKLELIRQIRDDEPQPPRQIVPDIPLALEQICLKAMSKRISDRYTTASDLANALRQVIQHAGDVARRCDRSATPCPLSKNPAYRRQRRQVTCTRRSDVRSRRCIWTSTIRMLTSTIWIPKNCAAWCSEFAS